VKARLTELTFTLTGKQRLVLELEGDFRQKFAELKDRDVRVEVKRWRKRRSLDSNAYAWVLMDRIAKQPGFPKPKSTAKR